MEFFKLERGVPQEVGRSQTKENAAFFEAENTQILLSNVYFPDEKSAGETCLSRVRKRKQIKVKIAGPAVIEGIPVDIVYFGSDWKDENYYYLRMEIIPGKLYCYSWIDKVTKNGGKLVSFEVIKKEK